MAITIKITKELAKKLIDGTVKIPNNGSITISVKDANIILGKP
jgi:hypothetical protein